jgi:hypothetical protein
MGITRTSKGSVSHRPTAQARGVGAQSSLQLYTREQSTRFAFSQSHSSAG